MKESGARNKTMVKLVWCMAVIVIIIGLVRLMMVFSQTHTSDQNLIQRSQ